MNKEARKFSEILNIPGVWVELCFSNDWYSEINDAQYFITQNKKNSRRKYWDCCYTLN